MSSEGVNHRSDRRRSSTAGKVEIEHSLNRSRLKSVNERTGSVVERSVPRSSTVGRSGERNERILRGRSFGRCRGGSSVRRDWVRARRVDGSVRGERSGDGGGNDFGRLDSERERDDLGDVRFRSKSSYQLVSFPPHSARQKRTYT